MIKRQSADNRIPVSTLTCFKPNNPQQIIRTQYDVTACREKQGDRVNLRRVPKIGATIFCL